MAQLVQYGSSSTQRVEEKWHNWYSTTRFLYTSLNNREDLGSTNAYTHTTNEHLQATLAALRDALREGEAPQWCAFE